MVRGCNGSQFFEEAPRPLIPLRTKKVKDMEYAPSHH